MTSKVVTSAIIKAIVVHAMGLICPTATYSTRITAGKSRKRAPSYAIGAILPLVAMVAMCVIFTLVWIVIA